MGKSETLNILSHERVFIEVENWIARCSRTCRAYFASEREPLKLKTTKWFLQMLCFVFLVFLSKKNGQMQSKLDK